MLFEVALVLLFVSVLLLLSEYPALVTNRTGRFALEV